MQIIDEQMHLRAPLLTYFRNSPQFTSGIDSRLLHLPDMSRLSHFRLLCFLLSLSCQCRYRLIGLIPSGRSCRILCRFLLTGVRSKHPPKNPAPIQFISDLILRRVGRGETRSIKRLPILGMDPTTNWIGPVRVILWDLILTDPSCHSFFVISMIGRSFS